MNLSGKVAVVTGAGSGLGRATAEYLAEAKGVRVALLDRAGAPTVAAALGTEHALGLDVDVTDEPAVAGAIAEVTARFGAVHVCVNCAGVPGGMRVVEPDGAARNGEVFRNTIAVNLIGTFHVMSHCAAHMANNLAEADERGVIVNVASIAAFEGQRGQSAYAASKAGVVGLTLPAARELAQFGIRVNAIAPGLFMTAMAKSISEPVLRSLLEQPVFPQRPGELEEFARLVAHICENVYLNGECIRLDAAARLGR